MMKIQIKQIKNLRLEAKVVSISVYLKKRLYLISLLSFFQRIIKFKRKRIKLFIRKTMEILKI